MRAAKAAASARSLSTMLARAGANTAGWMLTKDEKSDTNDARLYDGGQGMYGGRCLESLRCSTTVHR